MKPSWSTFLSLSSIASLAAAQFPAAPTNLTVVSSTVDSNVKISYKQTTVCETGAKTFSGFVQIPANLTTDVGGFDINTYFMYFEAREEPESAPVAVYLAGGPGEASSYAALSGESGPCIVNYFGNDTLVNPWSFNQQANVLYIDQPVQAGFSYSDLVLGTFDLEEEVVNQVDNFTEVPAGNATFSAGIFANQDALLTTNLTASSARALWLFAEHWFSSFPEYATSSAQVSFWGNSYGGFWVPAVAVEMAQQLAGLPSDHPLADAGLAVDAIGITNGCIDLPAAMGGWPQYAYNNTYDVEFISEALYLESMTNITMPGGCLDLAQTCRDVGYEGDPDFVGANDTVNAVCEAAFLYCESIISVLNELNNVSAFDVAIASPDTCSFYVPVAEYLNRPAVQADLGVPLNWTWDSNTVTNVFGLASSGSAVGTGTGDSLRQDGVANIAYLLQHGVNVALVYGDRDYRCPWTGAEATVRAATWPGQGDFAGAGYTEVRGLPDGARGAVVKEYGGLSFTRVFDAGHQVSAYAPEAVYHVFNRTLAGLDVATGSHRAGQFSGFRTSGPTESWRWRNTMPADAPIENTCVVDGHFLPENPWDWVLA